MRYHASLRKSSVAILLLLPISVSLRAQGLGDYSFISWSAEDAVATEPTPPDANYVDRLRAEQDSHGTRLVEVEYNFLANGDIERYLRTIVDYADAAGISSAGNAVVYVNSFSEQLEIEEAYVTTADGAIVPVDGSSVQVLLEDDGGVFSDDHAVVLPWPNLAPGAASTFAYRVLSRGDRRAAPWSQIVLPQTSVPTVQFDLLVRWENGVEPPVVETDYAGVSCETAGNSIRCESREIAPAPVDADVNYLDELGHLVVAERTSWADLAELLRGYVENSWTDEQAVAAMAEQIVAGADTESEKLAALHSFVSEQVRYVGIETGVNGVVPRDTGLTLSRRYGDCKDKTALFLQMAELAGLSAHPVVVSSHRKNVSRLITAGLTYFDHMIACVDVDGESICVDLTDPYSPTVAQPVYLHDAVALRLAEGTTEATQMEGAPAAWMLDVALQRELDGGTVHETEVRTYGPAFSGMMRSSLSGLNRTELQRWAREQHEEIYATGVPIEFEIEGLATQQALFRVSSSASFENSIIPDEPLHYEHYPGWLVDLVASFYSTNEHYDYRLVGFGYHEMAEFTLDEWTFVAPGAEIMFESEFGRMGRRYNFESGKLTVETVVMVEARTVPLPDIERFNSFLDTIIDNSMIRFRARP